MLRLSHWQVSLGLAITSVGAVGVPWLFAGALSAVLVAFIAANALNVHILRLRYKAKQNLRWLVVHRFISHATLARKIKQLFGIPADTPILGLSLGGYDYDSGETMSLTEFPDPILCLDFFTGVVYHVVTEPDEASKLSRFGVSAPSGQAIPVADLWDDSKQTAWIELCVQILTQGYAILRASDEQTARTRQFDDLAEKTVWNLPEAEKMKTSMSVAPQTESSEPYSLGLHYGYAKAGMDGSHVQMFVWPIDPEMRQIGQQLCKDYGQIAERCAAILLSSLGASPGEYGLPGEQELLPNALGLAKMTLMRYTKPSPTRSPNELPHWDPSWVTVSPRSRIPGLEAMDLQLGRWHCVEEEMTSNDLIVFAGTWLAWATNGFYRPLLHRVTPRGFPRTSKIYFSQGYGSQIVTGIAPVVPLSSTSNPPQREEELAQRYLTTLVFQKAAVTPFQLLLAAFREKILKSRGVF